MREPCFYGNPVLDGRWVFLWGQCRCCLGSSGAAGVALRAAYSGINRTYNKHTSYQDRFELLLRMRSIEIQGCLSTVGFCGLEGVWHSRLEIAIGSQTSSLGGT